MGRNSASNEPPAEAQTGAALGKATNRATRISISISLEMQEWMAQECSRLGRSLSNLASFWVKEKAEALALEQGIKLAGPYTRIRPSRWSLRFTPADLDPLEWSHC